MGRTGGRSIGYLAAALVLCGAATGCGFIARASRPASPVEATASTQAPDISADGRWVVFQSSAVNLVANDTNQRSDIFRLDRQTNHIERVSLTDSDGQATGGSLGAVTVNPSISDDGRYVAFESDTTNLVAGDTNGVRDIFVRDTQLGTTTRASVSITEAQSDGTSRFAQIIGDGDAGWLVAFDSLATNLAGSDTNGVRDVFVRTVDGHTERVSIADDGSQANGASERPQMSGFSSPRIVFSSTATNLLPGDTNGTTDVFMYSWASGQTSLVSRTSTGGFPNSLSGQVGGFGISRDGRWVAFTSNGNNLITGVGGGEIYLLDRTTNTLDHVSRTTAGVEGNSVSGAGPIGVSDDGRYVSFVSLASNFASGDAASTTDVFLRDRTVGALTLVSRTASSATTPVQSALSQSVISGDGAIVAWASSAATVVTNDTNGTTDLFLFARSAGTNSRVTASPEPNAISGLSDISSDARFTAFVSDATNLVVGDTNGVADVFVKDMVSGTVERVSVDSSEQQATGASIEGGYQSGSLVSISGDGNLVVFASVAQIAPGDTNSVVDIYLRDRTAGTTTLITTHDNAACGSFCFTGNAVDPQISTDGQHIVFLSNGTDMSWSNDSVAVDTGSGPTAYLFHRPSSSGYPVSVDVSLPLAFNSANAVSVETAGSVVSVAWSAIPQGTFTTTESGATRTIFQQHEFAVSKLHMGGIRHIAIDAGDLLPEDTNGFPDTYVIDRDTDGDGALDEPGFTSLELVSVSTTGALGNSPANASDITGDGRYIAFSSQATNMVADDTNDQDDIFMRDRVTDRTWRISLDQFGGQADQGSRDPRITPDGRYVTFASFAPDLLGTAADNNGTADVFVKAALIPDVTGMSPTSGARGTTVPVTITGRGFLPGMVLFTVNNGISIGSVNVVSDTTITATFTIASGASTGQFGVLVGLPGTTLGLTAGTADLFLNFTVT